MFDQSMQEVLRSTQERIANGEEFIIFCGGGKMRDEVVEFCPEFKPFTDVHPYVAFGTALIFAKDTPDNFAPSFMAHVQVHFHTWGRWTRSFQNEYRSCLDPICGEVESRPKRGGWG